jgi:hypothetical protein
MRSGGNAVYPEISGLEKARRFQTTNAGMCRVALHPDFGANMYPATMFTTAPVNVIEEALSQCQGTATRGVGLSENIPDCDCCSCAKNMPRHPVHSLLAKAKSEINPRHYSSKPFCC